MIGLIELSTIKTVRICAIVVHYLILPVAYTTTYMLLKLQLKHKTMSCTITDAVGMVCPMDLYHHFHVHLVIGLAFHIDHV